MNKITVDRCSQCPFFNEVGNDACGHFTRLDKYSVIDDIYANKPPSWCPLRKGPTQINLKGVLTLAD